MRKRLIAAAAILAFVGFTALMPKMKAFADQSERVPPTSGILTAIQFSQKLGDMVRSISTMNKGPTAPANVGGTAVDGLEWLDDSGTPWLWKRYINGNWATQGAFKASDSTYIGMIGGGVPASVGSASTVDLGSVPQANVTVTGTATVTGFGSAAPAGIIKFIRFDNALILTNSANLLVPGGYNLTTAANDRAIVTHLGSGVWEITQYTRANGSPIDFAALGEPRMNFQAATLPLHLPGDGRSILRTSYPAYTAKMSRAQNGTRTSGNATITGIADTSRFGVGMPVEGTGINAGCTVANFVANTSITLNSSSCVTASGTSIVTVFLTGYGSGGSSSTIGVPNCQGAVIAGLDPTRARLTLASTGFNADAAAMNVFSGLESRNLSIANINSFTPTASFSGSLSSLNAAIPIREYNPNGATDNTHLSAGSNLGNDAGSFNGSTVTGSVTGTVTVNSLGSGTAHSVHQPTLIAQCDIRVIP